MLLRNIKIFGHMEVAEIKIIKKEAGILPRMGMAARRKEREHI